MMNLEKFKYYMNHIVDIQELNDNIGKILSEYNNKSKSSECSFMFPDLVVDVIELLTNEFDDTEDWIGYWVFELDCGKNYKDGMVKFEDGEIIKLKTIEDLYNVLTDDRFGGEIEGLEDFEDAKNIKLTEEDLERFKKMFGIYIGDKDGDN